MLVFERELLLITLPVIFEEILAYPTYSIVDQIKNNLLLLLRQLRPMVSLRQYASIVTLNWRMATSPIRHSHYMKVFLRIVSPSLFGPHLFLLLVCFHSNILLGETTDPFLWDNSSRPVSLPLQIWLCLKIITQKKLSLVTPHS